MPPHQSDQMSQGNKALGSLFEGVFYMYLSLSLSLSLSLCFLFGQVKSPHQSDQMSQGSQGSRVTLHVKK